VVEELAARVGIVHRLGIPLSEAALRGADEIWLSSAARESVAVTALDGAPVGTGQCRRRCGGAIYDELQQYKREATRGGPGD
jgi:D-alanine transaminase